MSVHRNATNSDPLALLRPYSLKNPALEKFETVKAGWVLNLYPGAGEASGCFIPAARSSLSSGNFEATQDRIRSLEEASRRARGMIRRYCAHNQLNRLGTLTFSGVGCHDPRELRNYLAEFFKKLKDAIGGDLPYLWVPKWHKSHGLHVHFAVGRYIKRSVIESAWLHGFVHIKILGDLPTGSGARDQARIAAGYLAKYVGKDLGDDRNPIRLHRYDIAQGFKPTPLRLFAQTQSEVLKADVEMIGAPYDYFWSSNDLTTWGGAPAVHLSW